VPLRDPVAVYLAANTLEATLLCNMLREAGIEAFITADVTQAGTWVGGIVPETHEPQVWTERADIERVTPILAEYERRANELPETAPPEEETMQAVCEDCGKAASFPVRLRGSVQSCPNCGSYMDVGIQETPEEAAGAEGSEGGEE